MEIAILGLHRPSINRAEAMRADRRWVLNDWYLFLPWLDRPDRVYQIHVGGFSKFLPKCRFAGWREQYEKSGANIHVCEDLGFSKQVFFPALKHHSEYGPLALSSSISMMIADAIDEKPKKISLHGVKLSKGDEYEVQAPGVVYMLKKARELGIECVASNEEEWGNCTIPEPAGCEVIYGGLLKVVLNV